MPGKQKLRETPQRKVILEEVRKSSLHPTADDIYEAVRRRMPHISLGTVYRNLQIMVDAGWIREVPTSDPRRHYDGNADDHEHVQCVKCGRIVDVSGIDTDGLVRHARQATGFDILELKLKVSGRCPACRAEEN